MLLNITLLMILSASFLLVNTTAETASTHGYDPWVDIWPIEGDGEINLYDAVELLTKYGTTGDPTRNVNVTNWPSSWTDGKEYLFFNYKFGNRPTIYGTNTDPTEYSTSNAGFPVIIKQYVIDGTLYNSNVSSAAMFELEADVLSKSCIGGHWIWIYITINGISHGPYGYCTSGVYEHKRIGGFSPDCDINTSRIDNQISIGICGNDDAGVSVKNMKGKVLYNYNKTELSPEDFGHSRLYLKSVTLQPEEAIMLNGNPTQTITNPTSDTMILDFSEKVLVTSIMCLCGNPEIQVYGEVGS